MNITCAGLKSQDKGMRAFFLFNCWASSSQMCKARVESDSLARGVSLSYYTSYYSNSLVYYRFVEKWLMLKIKLSYLFSPFIFFPLYFNIILTIDVLKIFFFTGSFLVNNLRITVPNCIFVVLRLCPGLYGLSIRFLVAVARK